MTGHGFSISPAVTAAPEPVTLLMPPAGYVASAYITDPCGRPVPGASVTVAGNVATPHGLPAGTSYVDWRVSAAHPAQSGARVSLVLASRQTVGGRVTTCTTGASPYGMAHHRPAAAVAAHGGDPLTAVYVMVAAAVALLALAVAGWRLLPGMVRGRGDHARGRSR